MVDVSEIMLLLAPAKGFSDPEACLSAKRVSAIKLGIKGEEKRIV